MRILSLLAASILCSVSPAAAQSVKPGETFSTVVVRPVSDPHPVPGADGRVHLAYELLVSNPSRLFVTLEKVEAVDGAGRVLGGLDGGGLSNMTEMYGGVAGRTLPPGGTAVVFMDVSFSAGENLPAVIAGRVTATRQAAGPDGKPAPMPEGGPLPSSFTFTGEGMKVGGSPVVVKAPLKGKGWVAVNGCCDAITSHRGAVLSINGELRVPERYAIDWVKLDENGRVFTGDVARLDSYAYYGTPVHAVADGVVVNRYDAADEQVPGEDAKNITLENVGGNMLVVDIGGGAFAFYAHLQRGSLKAELGDRVRAGEVIGLLGNTGNSTAPHLHFHVMDGPSPLDANGLPFVITRFSSPGVLDSGLDALLDKGEPARIDPRLSGDHAGQMPLNNQVVDFD